MTHAEEHNPLHSDGDTLVELSNPRLFAETEASPSNVPGSEHSTPPEKTNPELGLSALLEDMKAIDDGNLYFPGSESILARRSETSFFVDAEDKTHLQQLLEQKTLRDLFATLSQCERSDRARPQGEFLLGMSAGEIEVATASFLKGCYKRLIQTDQQLFESDSFDSLIANFIGGLSLNSTEGLREHLCQLLKKEFEQGMTMEFLKSFNGETIALLNAADTFEDFRAVLFNKLTPMRAELVLGALQTDLYNAAKEEAEKGGKPLEEVAAGFLEKDKILPPEIDRPHLINLLIASLGNFKIKESKDQEVTPT